MEEITQAVKAAVKELFDIDIEPVLTRPDEQFGDYSTNAAMQLAGQLQRNPRDIADQLISNVKGQTSHIKEVKVEGPGFINLYLTDEFLIKQAFEHKNDKALEGQEILVEFGDPNPFKEMHIGHLYSYIVGDAICSLLESAGAQVRRLSYHGDVGLHVAKAIWGMQKENFSPDNMSDPAKNNIGWYYARGAAAYQDDEQAKQEIDDINQKVYLQDASIKQLYEQGRERSFANFDSILQEVGIEPGNNKRYLESEAAPIGTEIVKQNVGRVFVESNGAIVYEGERVGLHTRVFLTGKGLPTYEAKDLGLTELKSRDFPNASRFIIITANEQAEYFKVMLAALNEINPAIAQKTKHLTHGFVTLSTGKMSSRTGDVYSASNLINDVKTASEKMQKNTSHEIEIGAIKYAFSKHRMGGDIAYDVQESISLDGNSGPYLQYAHARACSILAKAEGDHSVEVKDLRDGERSLVRKLGEYPEVVNRAVDDLMPHHVASYLYELAQVFNRFYENNRVIGEDRQDIRLKLVKLYADTLKQGLNLLNIAAPEKM